MLFAILSPSIFYIVRYQQLSGSFEYNYNNYKPYEGETSDDVYSIIHNNFNSVKYDKYYCDNIRFSYGDAMDNKCVYLMGEYCNRRLEPPNEVYCLNNVQSMVNVYSDQTNSYDYKKYSLQLKMLQNAGEPIFKYAKSWERMITLTSDLSFIIGIILIIILSNLFSMEYKTNMNMIIPSTKKGTKQLTMIKFFAANIVGWSLIIVSAILRLVIHLCFGSIQGWDTPLNSMQLNLYSFSPYALNMLQYYIVQIVFQLIACVFIVAIVSFLSKKTKSPLFTCILVLILLVYVNILQSFFKIDNMVTDFSLSSAFNTHNLFSTFKCFNLFGQPVLLPTLYIGILLIISTLFIFLSLFNFQRHKNKISQKITLKV